MSELVVIPIDELQAMIKNTVSEAIGDIKSEPEPQSRYMKASELCELLGIAKSTLSNWKRERKM